MKQTLANYAVCLALTVAAPALGVGLGAAVAACVMTAAQSSEGHGR